MASLTGRTLGAYEIRELLGTGGFAEVYKAYDQYLNADVALKVLHEFLARDSATSERFLAEARNMARLRGHPHIATIYALDKQEGLSYFVMELVEGGTLKDHLQPGVPLELDHALLWFGQIADALAYAHKHGLVHRDIKPANVLMRQPDWVLLSDFGIARVLEHTAWYSRGAASVMGTYTYMAPEQARGERVSPQADQYALGIILYQMLTGSLPFRAETPTALLLEHIQEPPPPPRERNPRITPAMEQVILRALAKEPAQRFPDVAAFAAATSDAASRKELLRISDIREAGTDADETILADVDKTVLAQMEGTVLAKTSNTVHAPARATAESKVASSQHASEERAVASSPPRRRMPLWLLIGSGAGGLVIVAAVALFAIPPLRHWIPGLAAPATHTPVPATATSIPATATSIPATATSIPATHTPVPATHTPVPATHTPVPATHTPVPATHTPVPATHTPVPATVIPFSSQVKVMLSAPTLIFSSQRSPQTQVITITNTGTGQLVFTPFPQQQHLPFAFAGRYPEDYHVARQYCTKHPLASHHHCSITITFTPGGSGRRDADLILFDNASDSPQFVLLGSKP